MPRFPLHIPTLGFALIASSGAALGQEVLPDRISYNEHIRPILSGTCFHCHGNDPGSLKAGRRLDTREGALARSRKGVRAVVPGRLRLRKRSTVKKLGAQICAQLGARAEREGNLKLARTYYENSLRTKNVLNVGFHYSSARLKVLKVD